MAEKRRNERRKARRGIRFPTYDLEEALKVARIVHTEGGGELEREVLAGQLKSTTKSGAFQKKVAAAKHFNLLTEKGNTLSNTDVSKAILSPTSEDESTNALIQALTSFRPFRGLIAAYSGKFMPREDTLGNILERRYGISPVSKTDAAKCFISSGKTANVITEKNGKLFCERVKLKEEPRRKEKIPLEREPQSMIETSLPSVFVGVSITSGMSEEDIRKAIRILLDETRKANKTE